MSDSRFREFIRGELVKVVTNAENIERLTSPEAMETWTSAFTHSSVIGIPGKNYEGLETIGDAYLAAFFFSYVDKNLLKREQTTPSYFTELKRYWLSKPQLAKFSDELKFSPHVKLDRAVLNKPDIHVKEDVFESFFGALVTIADKLITPGVGYIYGFNYFVNFIKDKKLLLPEEEIFPRKTFLKELFDGLRWGEVRYPTTSSTGSLITVDVLDIDDDPLASGTGRDRQAAEEVAAVNAIAALAERGITKETITASKPVDAEFEALKGRVTQFLAKKGKYGPLELVQLYKESGKNGRRLYELRTTQDFGTPDAMLVQLSKGLGNSARDARLKVMTNYVTTHKIPV